jgi:DNA-binding response OmpR family regulator
MARILLIDDDPDVRNVMSILLKKHNHEVDTAFTKEDIYRKLDESRPSLILMDVLLAGADGREICRNIKSQDSTKDIPVIMFSAHPGAADKIDSYGADEFIAKPLNTESLLRKLDQYL